MKVFISWSGARSHAVAELLSEWIKCVLQATTPWVSSRDIDRGSLWFSEIGVQLQETTVGIICITKENKDRPWILFEAGALAKGLTTSRVCTLLIDLEPSDLEDPLAQFNHTTPKREDVYKLVATLNRALGESRLEPKTLEQVFLTYWPQFEEGFSKAIADFPDTGTYKERTEDSILREILENTRDLTKRVRHLERTDLNMPTSEEISKRETPLTRYSDLIKLIKDADVKLGSDGLPEEVILTTPHRIPVTTRGVLRGLVESEYGGHPDIRIEKPQD